MIDKSKITWGNSTEFVWMPDLPERKILKLLFRWERFKVKYSAAAFQLGIYEGGYKNLPTKDDIQTAVNHWWYEFNDMFEGPPPPFFDPIIADIIPWRDAGIAGIGHLITIAEYTQGVPLYWQMQSMIWAYGVWTCLLVGCNTMFIELQRQSSRGRPRKNK